MAHMTQHTSLEELTAKGEFLVVEDINGNTVIIQASNLYKHPGNKHGTSDRALQYLIGEVLHGMPESYHRIMCHYDNLRRQDDAT